MLSISMILTIIAIVIILVILFKLLGLISAALKIPAPWAQIIYWVIVLIACLWAFSALGITQPILK